MADSKHSKHKDVLNQLKGLAASGIIAQKSTGMVYLDIDDDFIMKSLEVLRPIGYIKPTFLHLPSAPILIDNMLWFREEVPYFKSYHIGAHIVIAEDHEMKENGGEMSHIGERVHFELVEAEISYPEDREGGVEALYKMRVQSGGLERLRRDLTGLETPLRGFFILLAIRIYG